MRYVKSSLIFIVTAHVISNGVHFSALIINTPATFGPAALTISMDGHSNTLIGFRP